MKILRRILLGLVGLLVVAAIALALVMSHTADCPPPLQADENADNMRAVLYRCYGAPEEVLEVASIPKPQPAANQLLVEVKAAGVNPLDWHFMRGSPYLLRLINGIGAPDDPRLGRDFAGTVVAVGSDVERFQPGDNVFGGAQGAFGQYITVRAGGSVAAMPENVSFEQAAGLPIAAITAIQALRDHGQLQAGQRVLINGASGGVGSYAVQIASSMGAHVSGVCSGRNVELVEGLGADQVFNYKEEDYTESGQSWDLIVDMVGNNSPLDNREVLTPNGRLVLVGGAKGNWLAPLIGPMKASLSNMFVDQELMSFTATLRPEDLAALAEMMAAGELTTVVDRTYPLAETAAAIAHSESGRTRGKIIITVD